MKITVLKDANISRIHYYSIQEIITPSCSSCDLAVTVSVEFTHNNFMKHATLFYCTVKGLCFIFLIKKGNDNNKDPIGSPHFFDKKSRCTTRRTLMSKVEKASPVVTQTLLHSCHCHGDDDEDVPTEIEWLVRTTNECQREGRMDSAFFGLNSNTISLKWALFRPTQNQIEKPSLLFLSFE